MCCDQRVFRLIWCVSLPDLSLYAKVCLIHIMISAYDLAAQCLLMDVTGRRNLSPDDRRRCTGHKYCTSADPYCLLSLPDAGPVGPLQKPRRPGLNHSQFNMTFSSHFTSLDGLVQDGIIPLFVITGLYGIV
jgi:hypothetical protein